VVEGIAKKTRVLACGPEVAVAATKSVVEQALTYQAIFAALSGTAMTGLALLGLVKRAYRRC